MNHDSLSKRDVKLSLLLWFRLSRFYQESLHQSSKHLKEYDLSIAQFDVLAQVGTFKKLTQQELAEKLLVSKGNISQLLKKMEQDHLIKREPEWKYKYISLTEKGKELYDIVVPKQAIFQAGSFQSLNNDEKKQLVTLLKKLQGKNS